MRNLSQTPEYLWPGFAPHTGPTAIDVRLGQQTRPVLTSPGVQAQVETPNGMFKDQAAYKYGFRLWKNTQPVAIFPTYNKSIGMSKQVASQAGVNNPGFTNTVLTGPGDEVSAKLNSQQPTYRLGGL